MSRLIHERLIVLWTSREQAARPLSTRSLDPWPRARGDRIGQRGAAARLGRERSGLIAPGIPPIERTAESGGGRRS
jgi:hypothetical protein